MLAYRLNKSKIRGGRVRRRAEERHLEFVRQGSASHATACRQNPSPSGPARCSATARKHLFIHFAPRPRPTHSTVFPFCSPNRRRIISRLTPGQAGSLCYPASDCSRSPGICQWRPHDGADRAVLSSGPYDLWPTGCPQPLKRETTKKGTGWFSLKSKTSLSPPSVSPPFGFCSASSS